MNYGVLDEAKQWIAVLQRHCKHIVSMHTNNTRTDKWILEKEPRDMSSMDIQRPAVETLLWNQILAFIYRVVSMVLRCFSMLFKKNDSFAIFSDIIILIRYYVKCHAVNFDYYYYDMLQIQESTYSCYTIVPENKRVTSCLIQLIA